MTGKAINAHRGMTKKDIAAIRAQMRRNNVELAKFVRRDLLRDRLVEELRLAMLRWTQEEIPFDGCAISQSDIHLAVTGKDPAAEWRGRYTTARGMRRVMGKGGLVACMARAARRLGWPKVKPSAAQPGDVGIVVAPPAVAIVRMIRPGKWIGRNVRGFSEINTDAVRAAWSVAP